MAELECGITVYPARKEHGRWRAIWYENGERQQCEAIYPRRTPAGYPLAERLAARLEQAPR